MQVPGRDIDKLGVAGRNVNPSVCPFKYIKISGQVYQRTGYRGGQSNTIVPFH
jgi:hypothetical protein